MFSLLTADILILRLEKYCLKNTKNSKFWNSMKFEVNLKCREINSLTLMVKALSLFCNCYG